MRLKGKKKLIDTTQIDQGLNMDTNILNVKCMSVWRWY